VKCGDLSRSGEFSFAPGVVDSCLNRFGLEMMSRISS